MNWIPQLSNGYLAIAGLVCAMGPILIHLLNRHRFRTLDWAAMDFLFEAVQQQKRNLRLRDLLLLALRTAAVLFFGLALARPYLTSAHGSLDGNDPRHLILLIDNSLSMGYRQLDRSRLEQAQQEAAELVESLADGSQVTVSGLCGTNTNGHGPQRRKSDAIELIQGIPLIDGVARTEDAVALAQAAVGTAAPLPDQIVLLTDLQRSNWPTDVATEQLSDLPAVEIRDVSQREWQNTWIAELRLRDEVIDLGAEATVFVTVCHHGSTTRHVPVTLSLNETVMATQNIEFPPGLAQRTITFKCSFADAAAEPGDVTFVPLEASLSPDRLPQDDRQTIMVPIAAGLPTVFVDQFASEDENAALGRLGETRPLRQLLSPRASGNGEQPMAEIRHVTLSALNRSLLATARLVVVAGVAAPGPAIRLLEQYVRQGGPLIICAGETFDPVAWNAAAGPAGLLAGVFSAEPLGFTPDEADDRSLQPFRMSTNDFAAAPLFRLPGLTDEELQEVFQEPLFFKALELQLAASREERIAATPPPLAGDPMALTWLAWQTPRSSTPFSDENRESPPPSRESAVQCLSFDNPQQSPFLVKHQVGLGDVVLSTSSILPTWNNLAQTNAVVLWDHIMRSMISSTLPRRNFSTQQNIVLSVPRSRRGEVVQLQRPDRGDASEALDIGFVEKNRQGISVPAVWRRGLYRLNSAPWATDTAVAEPAPWKMDFAVTGPAQESDLSRLSADEIQQKIVDSHLGHMFTGGSLRGVQQLDRGVAFWWWLVLAVLLLLSSEMILLIVSYFKSRPVDVSV